MKNALKLVALGVALAASATMAKADPILGAGELNITVSGCDAVSTTTHCPSGKTEATGTGLFFSGQPLLTLGSGSLSAFTASTFSGSSQYIPYTEASGIQLFTDTASNGNFLVFDTTSTGQHLATVNGTVYDYSQFGTLTVYTDSSKTTEIGTGQGFVGVNPNGDLFTVGLVQASATPEPSSLALLGTGLLGMAGMARRRFMSR